MNAYRLPGRDSDPPPPRAPEGPRSDERLPFLVLGGVVLIGTGCAAWDLVARYGWMFGGALVLIGAGVLCCAIGAVVITGRTR